MFFDDVSMTFLRVAVRIAEDIKPLLRGVRKHSGFHAAPCRKLYKAVLVNEVVIKYKITNPILNT